MSGFHRLHTLRMENDAAGFAMRAAAPRAVSVYQLFQTPAPLAVRLVALLDLKPGARVLEPSAGLGRLLDALEPFKPAEVVAVENARECAAELFRQDRAGVTIKQRDFLALTPDDLGTFDAVVMNPPFHMRSDIRHIKHARQFLKPGGKLAAICLDGYKRREELQGAQWFEIEPDAFTESGTKVRTAICIFNSTTGDLP